MLAVSFYRTSRLERRHALASVRVQQDDYWMIARKAETMATCRPYQCVSIIGG